MKKYISILVVLLVLPLGFINAQNVGEGAPNFSLTADNGTTYTLNAHRDKVVFLFLFGNSCAHCIANGPNTESGIYQYFKNNSEVVTLGADVWNGSAGQVQSYKSSTGITFPVLLNASSLTSSYSTTYDRVVVIDQNGVIRFKSTNNATSSVVAQAKAVIDNLLQTTSIEVPSVEKFKAYINRGVKQLVFNKPYTSDELTEVRVMDMSGRIVYQRKQLLDEENRIPFNPDHKGLYFLSLNQSEGRHITKVLY